MSCPLQSSFSNVLSIHSYQGRSAINFVNYTDGGLAVTIDTDRLHMRSVEATEEDFNSYTTLFGDPDVMRKYAAGLTKSREETIERIRDVWANRWKENNPYSGFAVFRKDTKEFIGHVIVGHGDVSGESHIAYLLMKNHWGNGFGTEAVDALTREYAPATIQEGHKVEGKILEKITATVRVDNIPSKKILKKVGFHRTGFEEKFDGFRKLYTFDLTNLNVKA